MPNSPTAICRQTRDRLQLPGLAAALIDASRPGYPLIFSESFGLAQLELTVPLTSDCVFEIASLTKLFTAEMILLLVNDGQLSLGDTLGSHMPDLPESWQGITLEQILRHQSGIRNYTAVPEYWEHTHVDLPREHILALVKDLPLDFAPGSRYAYDNSGYYLLGILLEVVSGQSYGDLLQQRIFAPLYMSSTRMQDYTRLIPRRVAGYSRVDGQVRNKPYYSPTGTFSAGCLVSSLTDLSRWAASLQAETLLPQSLRQQMWTPVASGLANEADEGFTMGLGWFCLENGGQPFWGHNGSILGYTASLVHLPERHLSAIVLSNCDWFERPHELALELIQALPEAN